MATETDALHGMLRAALRAYEQARAIRAQAGRQAAAELEKSTQTLNAAQQSEQKRLEEQFQRRLTVAGGEQKRLGDLAAALTHLEQSARDLLGKAGLAHIAGAPLAVEGRAATARRGDAEVTALFTNAQTASVDLREAVYLLAVTQLESGQWEAARRSAAPLLTDKDAPFCDAAVELERQSYLGQARQALEAGQWEAVRTTLAAWLKGHKEDEDSVKLERQSYLGQAQEALEAGKWEAVRTHLTPWLKGHKEDEEAQTLHCESYYRPGRKALEAGQWSAALVALTALVGRKSNYKDTEDLQKKAIAGRFILKSKLDFNLVYIPAGEFVYDVGNQRINLAGFAISYSAITYDQFAAFVKATGYSATPAGAGNAPASAG